MYIFILKLLFQARYDILTAIESLGFRRVSVENNRHFSCKIYIEREKSKGEEKNKNRESEETSWNRKSEDKEVESKKKKDKESKEKRKNRKIDDNTSSGMERGYGRKLTAVLDHENDSKESFLTEKTIVEHNSTVINALYMMNNSQFGKHLFRKKLNTNGTAKIIASDISGSNKIVDSTAPTEDIRNILNGRDTISSSIINLDGTQLIGIEGETLENFHKFPESLVPKSVNSSVLPTLPISMLGYLGQPNEKKSKAGITKDFKHYASFNDVVAINNKSKITITRDAINLSSMDVVATGNKAKVKFPIQEHTLSEAVVTGEKSNFRQSTTLGKDERQKPKLKRLSETLSSHNRQSTTLGKDERPKTKLKRLSEMLSSHNNDLELNKKYYDTMPAATIKVSLTSDPVENIINNLVEDVNDNLPPIREEFYGEFGSGISWIDSAEQILAYENFDAEEERRGHIESLCHEILFVRTPESLQKRTY